MVFAPAAVARLQLLWITRFLVSSKATVAVGEIDSAKINLRRRSDQLAAAQREVAEVDNARNLAREQFESGLTSEMEFLDVERVWLDAKRSRATLEQARLNAEIDLIKASGGGVD
ncbi:MAG: TolC family protein [Luteolibacter sp.]